MSLLFPKRPDWPLNKIEALARSLGVGITSVCTTSITVENTSVPCWKLNFCGLNGNILYLEAKLHGIIHTPEKGPEPTIEVDGVVYTVTKIREMRDRVLCSK